jgi:hypothetical protein
LMRLRLASSFAFFEKPFLASPRRRPLLEAPRLPPFRSASLTWSHQRSCQCSAVALFANCAKL